MSGNEVMLFTGELCDLLEGGMTLGNALNCLASRGDGESGPSQVITALRDSIIEGANFSAALEKFPKVFSPIFINMIRAGEASGALTDVLKRLITHFERAHAMHSKVIGAMVYPVIVLIMGFGVAVFAMTYILPKFQTIFDQMGHDALPTMTKMLIGISEWTKKYAILVLIAMIAGVIALRKWIQTPPGRRKWDGLKLKLPLVRGIVASATYANFARTLQSLLENGVPVLQALKITSQTVGNAVIGDELLNARERVTDGTTISGPLAAGGVFPPTIIDLISIGEQTGDMPAALGHIAKRYENELEKNVTIFTAALEPIMIFVVALIIAFVAISVMQAVLGVTSGMNIK
jgi:type II secretory pathway component PulF